MEYKQGSIYLADLNPKRKTTEVGKIRPVLVIQTDLLNSVEHPSTIVVPLTSNIKNGFKLLRYRVTQREELKQDSDILIDQIRSIDNQRFREKEIAKLTDLEIKEVLDLVCNIFKRDED